MLSLRLDIFRRQKKKVVALKILYYLGFRWSTFFCLLIKTRKKQPLTGALERSLVMPKTCHERRLETSS